MEETAQILQSNRNFKESVLNTTKEFLKMRTEFIEKCPDLSIDPEKTERTATPFESFTEELIQQYTVHQQPAITVCGPNSSGKTAFVQHFLQIGEIFPSDIGPVTTRIVKLTYSPADKAYAHIFSSLEDRLTNQDPQTIVPLDQFFLYRNSNSSEDLRKQLSIHLKRPEGLEGDQFDQWSKYFIEIGLPSPILQLGLDVYDTPGFLSGGRDEILNRNLHQLMKLVQPVLLFLYSNPPVSETDQACFLSFKQALGSFENTPIFFLNTQADPLAILKNEKVNIKRTVTEEKFKEALRSSREKRYQQLLEHEVIANEVIGGLPELVDDCDCFDICSVPKGTSPFREYAPLINEGTFRRIIQFAARSDRTAYQILADQILSSIDEYFDFVFSTTCGTEDQWNQLRDAAIQWAERFFQNIQDTLPTIITTILQNILTLFDKQKDSIADLAGSLTRDTDRSGMKLPPSAYRVRDFIKAAVYEQVFKVAASESMKASLANIDQISNDNLLHNKKKNELLSMAKRYIQFWEISGEDLNRKKFFTVVLEHLVEVPQRISRWVTSLRTRPYLDWYNEHTNQYGLLDTLDRFANLTNESKRKEYAHEYLVKMRENIAEQKPLFERNLAEWIETKRLEFNHRIETGYQYAIAHMKERRKAHQLTEIYSEKFAKCECQLIAAKNVVHFNGLKPTIYEDQPIGIGGFFDVHVARWNDQENLAVKRQNNLTKDEYPYMSFMEAHYHRAITSTRQANIVPLLYLYYENNDLCIFMPRYTQSLFDYLQKNISTIKFDEVLSFALVIANILHDIHQNDLVHRDIKTSNILLDEKKQCYLADFGTVGEGTTKKTIVGTFPLSPEILRAAMFQQQSLATVYDGKANDIFSYGVFLYELLPKKEYYRPKSETVCDPESLLENGKILPIPSNMQDYEQLILDCLDRIPDHRPTASMISKRIDELIRLCEVRRCSICLERERTVRTQPCGHKVLCRPCRNDLRSRNYDLCIVCKRLMSQDVYDDTQQTFLVRQ